MEEEGQSSIALFSVALSKGWSTLNTQTTEVNMRHLLSTFLFLALLLPLTAHTAVFDAKYLHSIYTNEDLETGRGFELSLGPNMSSRWPPVLRVSLWCSFGEAILTFGGQFMSNMQLYGGGLKLEKQNWFIKFGYYKPKPRLMAPSKEALWLKMNDILHGSYAPADYHGNEFSYEISGDIGASVGWGSEFQISGPVYGYFSVEYRWLKLKSMVICRFPDGGYWEVYHYEDFSGALVTVGARVRW